MSVEAIAWALAQPVGRSSAKFVLVAMANCANADMLCWPSVAYLVTATCQDRKTVIENMRRLREEGYIVQMSGSKGRTASVPIYRLSSTENGTPKQSRFSAEAVPKTGPVPKTEPVPKTDTSSPVFPQKQSRFSAEAVPKTGHGTVIETSMEPSGNYRRCAARPHDVDELVWSDWLAVRRAKRAGPVTATVLAGMRREAAKAGVSVEAAIRTCAERGWQGFRADWLRPAAAAGNGHEPEWRREQRARNVAFLGPAASPEARAAVAAERARNLGHVVDITATELSNDPAASLG